MTQHKSTLHPDVKNYAQHVLTTLQRASSELSALENRPERMKQRAKHFHAMCLKLKTEIDTARKEQDGPIAELKARLAAR